MTFRIHFATSVGRQVEATHHESIFEAAAQEFINPLKNPGRTLIITEAYFHGIA